MNRLTPLTEETYFDSDTGTFVDMPLIVTFGADRQVLVNEQPAVVTWEVKDAMTVTLNGEAVALTGSRSFYTDRVMEIVLIAVNRIEKPVRRALTIRAERALPVIEFFTANKEFVVQGMPVSLSWNVGGAARVEIDNGIGTVTGRNSIDVTIGQSGVFNLTAYNHFGDKSFASTSVTVFPIPLIRGVFCGTPGFKIKPISIKQLCFTAALIVSGNIAPYAPPLIKPVSFEKKLVLNRMPVDFVLFHGNKQSFSFNNHNNIITHIKLLWKRLFTDEMLEKLKRRFRAKMMENLPQNLQD
jgi:hypothetical protein